MSTKPVERIAGAFGALCGAAVWCMLSFLVAGWLAMCCLAIREAEYEAAAYCLMTTGVLTAIWQLNTVAKSRAFARKIMTDLLEGLTGR